MGATYFHIVVRYRRKKERLAERTLSSTAQLKALGEHAVSDDRG